MLNGEKMWITNGGIADFFTVFAKTARRAERGGMTAFIVDPRHAGVSTGPHEDKMGIRASSTTTVMASSDVRVPRRPSASARSGKGFKVGDEDPQRGPHRASAAVGGRDEEADRALGARQAKERGSSAGQSPSSG